MQKLTRFNSFIHHFKCIRNMKMQTQTFILQSSIFVLVFLIIITSQMINKNMMDDIIQRITKEIEIKTNLKQINIQSQFIKYQAHYPLEQGFKFLESFNRLNQMILKDQQTSINKLLDCKQVEESFNFFSKMPLFCYKFTKTNIITSDESLINHIIGYQALLNSIFLPISISQFQKTMFFTFISDEEYFAILPPKIVPDIYLPSQRPWYLEQIQSIQQTKQNDVIVISSIYQDFETQKYEFTLTKGITDQEQHFRGIFGIDQTLEHYKELLLYKDLNIILVDLKGRMLLSNLMIEQEIDLSKEKKYIYEIGTTGFDENDWKQIVNEANQQGQGTIECSDKDIKQFCRYNTFFKQDLIIIVINISSQFYLLVFQSLAHITTDVTRAQELQDEIMSEITQFLYYCIIVAVILLLLSIIIIPIFFRPLKNIQTMIKTQMVQKFTIHYDHLFFSNRKKNKLAFFEESFNVFKQKLLDFTQSKSQDCYIIENFKYPRQQQIIISELTSFIKFQTFKDKIENLPNQNNQIVQSPKLFCDTFLNYSQDNQNNVIQISPRDVTFRIELQHNQI
ncbi:unnamed protein product [Paramecium pentaurelia]|uniref:Transmembrane protein n=1 Tax=Paramecium pentaurelia TaxID=43138 RepID=A0A8S1VJZ1_9CILI|nr:unnamed protein product [Paramecium pentaurelia]